MLNFIKPCNIIIFGALGDLSKRKLIPSLYKLEKINLISKYTRIICVDKFILNFKIYYKLIFNSIKYFINENININIWNKLKSKIIFCMFNINKIDNYKKLLNKLNNKNFINIGYFAVSSDKFNNICIGLKNINLNKNNTRIVLEKPIGLDLKSFKIINNLILKYFTEKQIYRIDHYLGKTILLKLLSLRFNNSLFYNVWNNNMIDKMEIIVSENIGIENRYDYFDKVGLLRDMVQSHLLQILSILTMSKPKVFNEFYLQKNKIKILKSLKLINISNLKDVLIFGQYTDNIINNKKISSYLKDSKNKYSNTETFVCIKAEINNKKWSGVPFFLYTGKRLKMKFSEIIIYFKRNKKNIFSEFNNSNLQNKLIIRLQPDKNIKIQFFTNKLDLNNNNLLESNLLSYNFKENIQYMSSYSRLLLEVINGSHKFFLSTQEIEASWVWIDSIINACKICNYIPIKYQSGTWGPNSSFISINY